MLVRSVCVTPFKFGDMLCTVCSSPREDPDACAVLNVGGTLPRWLSEGLESCHWVRPCLGRLPWRVQEGALSMRALRWAGVGSYSPGGWCNLPGSLRLWVELSETQAVSPDLFSICRTGRAPSLCFGGGRYEGSVCGCLHLQVHGALGPHQLPPHSCRCTKEAAF